MTDTEEIDYRVKATGERICICQVKTWWRAYLESYGAPVRNWGSVMLHRVAMRDHADRLVQARTKDELLEKIKKFPFVTKP